MFAGNTSINTRRQNPGTLVVALIVAGIGYVGYRLFGKKAKAAGKKPGACPEGEIWSETAGKCIQHLGEKYIEVNGYKIPLPKTTGAVFILREEVGEPRVPNNSGQPFEEGRRFGLIVAWPTGTNGAIAPGAEFLYVRNAGYNAPPPGSSAYPLDGTYRVQVLSKYNDQDVAPKQAAIHKQNYGKYIDMPRTGFIKVFPPQPKVGDVMAEGVEESVRWRVVWAYEKNNQASPRPNYGALRNVYDGEFIDPAIGEPMPMTNWTPFGAGYYEIPRAIDETKDVARRRPWA